MSDQRDPVVDGLDDSTDLHDLATWEPRSVFDHVAVVVHAFLRSNRRTVVVLLAALLLIGQLGLAGYALLVRPLLGALVVLSAVPALGLAAFLYSKDRTMGAPLEALLVTFVLGALFASFAAAVNTFLQPVFGLVPVLGMALFFFLIVAPVEESVKWLAVRTFAYRQPTFDAVVDGAVYGAIAGLGFATIENALYVGQAAVQAMGDQGGTVLAAALSTATQRAFVGPGHVIYSAFAGYYLGLAKFNDEHAGPIVVKGLLVAAGLHATYNTFVTYAGLNFAQLIGFVLIFDGLLAYLLYRKLSAYDDAYERAVEPSEPAD